MRLLLYSIIAMSHLLYSTSLSAAKAQTPSVQIESTIVTTPDALGGCAARIIFDLSTLGLNCPAPGGKSYVTFSCTGDFISKDLAHKAFESIQLAMILNLSVSMIIDDSKTHNGHCFASRVFLASSS